MYHSWNLRKLLRYIAFDMALVLAAILLTRAGRQHFAAVDSAGGVSLPVLMYHSIAPVPETQYCISGNAGIRSAIFTGASLHSSISGRIDRLYRGYW